MPKKRPLADALEKRTGDKLKSFRAGKPVGTWQAQQMQRAAWMLQGAATRAAAVVIGIVSDQKAPMALRLDAAKWLFGAIGMRSESPINFSGMLMAGTPQDFQAAIDQAVATFMANRESFRVEAVDVTPAPEFHEGNGRDG